MQYIPLQPVPSQTLKVVLGGQNCQINVNQKPQGVFFDLSINGVDVVTNVIARDAVKLVCREYVGFVGNLLFNDSQGRDDPDYTGFADRFNLIYLNAEENAII